MNPDFRPDAHELEIRAGRLRKQLAAKGIEAALLVQEYDRYHISATLQNGYVLVPAEGETLVIVRKSAARASLETPLKVVELKSVRALPELVRQALGHAPENLGLEFDVLPYAQVQRLAGMFPGTEFKDVSGPMAMTRAIKSEWEVAMIREAAKIVDQAVAEIPAFLKAGMMEVELAARMEYEMRRRGHGGFTPMRGFNQRLHYGHVFAGATAAEAGGYDMPTVGRGLSPAVGQGPSLRRIEPGEAIVVDLVGHFEGYLCDQTRMFSIGPTSDENLRAFETALMIEQTVAAAARPGIRAGHLHTLSEKLASESGLGEHFLGEEQKVTFVGHGIGLEVDEYPFLAKGFDLTLEDGMVFALEPKFTFRGKAAVGIEDTFVVREGGAERLTVTAQEFMIVG